MSLSLIDELKNEIIRENKPFIPGIIFLFSEPLAFISIIVALRHTIQKFFMVNKNFSYSRLYMTIFLALSFWMRIKYMWNKPLARVLVVCNTIGWTTISLLYVLILIKYKKTKNDVKLYQNSEE